MFLLEPNETAWDLRWRMFGIPVRVHPFFWLLAALLGSSFLQMGAQYLLIWVACVFVSILIHELGHALTGMAFGAPGRIVLYAFGGMAINSNALHVRWQRIVVCAAGPVAGFLFLGVVLGALWLRDPDIGLGYVTVIGAELGLPLQLRGEAGALTVDFIRGHPIEFWTIDDLIFVNLVWGLLNLLPIWPLDGGQISREVCQGISPSGGLKFSLGLSLLTAGILCLNSIMAMKGKEFLPFGGDLFMAIFFGMFALQSFQMLQQAHAQEQWTERHRDRDDW